VIPAAVEEVGGRIEHFGMPVDPGNLLLVAEANGRPVLGAPGCARSPKENGFDWILMRLLAEIAGRPLARIVVEEALASRARPVIVVVGHERAKVENALAGLPVEVVYNPDFAQGLGTSVRAGIAAVPAEADGAIVCLGDMPQVDAALIDRLMAAFDPDRGALIVMPTVEGRRGNPVLWSRRFFHDLMAIEGDVGARHFIGRYSEAVADVPLEGSAALVDVDTPEALVGVKAAIEGAFSK